MKVRSISILVVLIALTACAPRNPPNQIELLRAANSGDLSRVEAMLSRSEIDINWRAGGTGITPLIGAVEGNHVQVVRSLLDKGADVNVATSDGYSALHAAVSLGFAEMCKILISAGADLNARMRYGATPLFFAARYNNLELISLLLSAGADRDQALSNGVKPIDIARRFGFIEAVRLLQLPGDGLYAPQTHAAFEGKPDSENNTKTSRNIR
jgi:ankyrin